MSPFEDHVVFEEMESCQGQPIEGIAPHPTSRGRQCLSLAPHAPSRGRVVPLLPSSVSSSIRTLKGVYGPQYSVQLVGIILVDARWPPFVELIWSVRMLELTLHLSCRS